MPPPADDEPPWNELSALAGTTASKLVPTRALEDVCQETIVAVLATYLAGKQIDNWRAYTCGVARRLCARWHRQYKETRLPEYEICIDDGTEWELLSWFREEFVPNLEQRLTPLQVQALHAFLHTQSMNEAADLLGRDKRDAYALFAAIRKKGIALAEKYPPPGN